MRDTPEGIVEELREAARLEAIELGVSEADLPGWQGADHIEHLRGQLKRIAEGEPEPVQIAAEALDPMLWVLSEPEVGDDG